MTQAVATAEDTGLEVLDLELEPAFALRRLHTRDTAAHLEGLRRLTAAFVESPETVLQELVNAAVELCGADSAGISIEQDQKTESSYWHWIATAGKYSDFLDATLPRVPSACGICLERGTPQLFRVTQRFFDTMRVDAPPVTDGLLLPWRVDEARGTIWIMAHERTEAFDPQDLRMMQVLADFAAMAIRHRRSQQTLVAQSTSAAAAALANELAHEINNPLQSLTNIVFLAAASDRDDRSLAQELSPHLQRLSRLVNRLLTIPKPPE